MNRAAPDPHVTAPASPSRVRFGVLALISLAVAVNYLDRAIIGIASPSIAQEFTLSPWRWG